MVILDDDHKISLDEVRRWVETNLNGSRQLSAQELSEVPVARPAIGWRIPFESGGTLQLVLDRDFPYSEPRVVVEGPPDLLGGPHLETKGKLCIAGDGGRVDSLKPIDVVKHVYGEALNLLKGNQAKKNDADFQHDFRAYWLRDAHNERPLLTLVAPVGPSRKIVSWTGKRSVIADDKALLTRFLTNTKLTTNVDVKAAFAIWMTRLPRPDEYPTSVDGFRRLVMGNSANGLKILDETLTSPSLPVVGVIVGPSGGGRPAALGGIRIAEKPGPSRFSGKIQDPLNKGFRPGKVPPAILAQRLQLTRVHVDEVDGAKSRRPPYLSSNLASKKVILIGCGSLGSGVAKLLLQSGVGNLALIDPDILGWVNIERHELGATSVDQNKASALAAELQPNFPLADLTAYPVPWRDVYRQNAELLEQADLIVSTCADWNAESALSDLQHSGALSGPVVYGWLEESALAAHAVVLDAAAPCLRCGFSATGEHLYPAVRAPREVPAGCAGAISLYGAIDMAPAQAMITAVALDMLLGTAKAPVHRTWLCPKSSLDSAGADWTPSWLAEHGPPPIGGTIVPCSWPAREGCSCRS